MSEKPLVLVTGASSFVGSHVILQLLSEGYPVRGTARAAKLDILRSSVGLVYPTQLEIVQVDDIATDDLTEALQGVGAVIHVASPLAGKVPPKDAVETALSGTLNVLEQCHKVNIPKVVLTSSWGTTLDPSLKEVYEGVTFTEKDWGSVSDNEILDGTHNPLWIYLATKILAESAAWKFVEKHPEIDLATINPPFIYGPIASGFPIPGPTALGTNRMIFALISGDSGRPLPMQLPPFFCDVRDVARAHVAALKAPRIASGTLHNKRFLISGGSFTWKEAVEHISRTKPDLKNRLPSTDNAPALPGTLSSIDCNLAKESLGIDEYISWEKTVDDTVQSLLLAESSWK